MQQIGDVINKIVKKRNLGDQKQLQADVLNDPKVRQFLHANQNKITKQMVINSMTNLFEFYMQINNANKVMAGYRPELFLNGNVIDVRYAPTEEKIDRERERDTKRHLELIDLPAKLHNVKLSQIDMTDDRSDVLGEIQSFLTKYSKDIHQKGLYLSGDFGVGKTYILAGLANQVAAMGKQVIFLHVPTFIAGLTSHFEDNSLQKEIQKVANCDLLILDDIGAESLSQWSRDDVLGVILQARMDNVLPTFFSSNFDMEKLEAHFAETRNAIDPVKAARLMQRVRFLAKEVIVSGPNRRKI
ncbi:primosomal protein DnaI [Lactobacillus hamsteri]|uniref:Primosomal protein DnaI n=1 Tax=Lactobacillus hamsteri DSM 5661 = JCM 6256 TaxID=1423754 RepID=A0A0R1Y6M5_9LACO|nr:primosomal protein DnaI [Lactobacillus hamsteri]KRM37946.1 primosomal protein DnaI [Lactobacillus hamsteri DSM 5661 = JCM 6256]